MSSDASPSQPRPHIDEPATLNPFNHITQWTAASSTGTFDDSTPNHSRDSRPPSTGTSTNTTPPPPAGPPAVPNPPLWTHRLSASFSAMADQIAAASQALALIPTDASINAARPSRTETAALTARVEALERTQERLSAEFEALKEQFTLLSTSTDDRRELENKGVEEVEKKITGLAEMVKLDQMRLYARLLNSSVTVSKMPIKAPIMANGKTPPNFPATKGEFEHLTKERYESILKAYDLPIKGDTAAKREAVRSFIGLPA